MTAQVGASVDPAGSAVPTQEDRSRRAPARRFPRSAGSRWTVARIEVLVLGREGVDRRRDHHDPAAIEAVPGERRAREDVQLALRARKEAGSPGPRASALGASTPMWQRQTTRTPRSPTAGQAGGLGIVEQHDVARRDLSGQLARLGKHRAYVAASGHPSGHPVARATVHRRLCSRLVMRKKSISPLMTTPPGIHSGAATYRQHQRGEHLGHAAPAGRRVGTFHTTCPPVQLPCALDGSRESLSACSGPHCWKRSHGTAGTTSESRATDSLMETAHLRESTW